MPTANYPGYIYDTCIGAAPGCTPTAINVTGSAVAVSIVNASDNARYAVYAEQGTTNSEIVLHDTCLGAAPGCVISDNVISDTSKNCRTPTIIHNAQFVTYYCVVSGLSEVFVQNTCVGASGSCISTATQITSGNTGLAQNSSAAGVSDDGRFVAFNTQNATVAGLDLGEQMFFVSDTCNGVVPPATCTPQTGPACLNAQGAVADADCYGEITPDGQYVVLNSQATNLSTLPNGAALPSYIAPNPVK